MFKINENEVIELVYFDDDIKIEILPYFMYFIFRERHKNDLTYLKEELKNFLTKNKGVMKNLRLVLH